MTAPIHGDNLRALPELSAPGCPRETPGSNALERWRERCRLAAETGHDLPPVDSLEDLEFRLTMQETLLSMLRDTILHDDPEQLRVDLGLAGVRYGDDQAIGCACFFASAWLREELARDGGDHG